ncbi:MAG: Epoxyqueuosine reductase [Syntrophorhabdus sp. PtaB.Bin184]|jgi:epoxyqueuosine reductase|nr:MAG: Epoxyqueuosine reductase [Syntrophorhabdus sp. PtaB.Bin184]
MTGKEGRVRYNEKLEGWLRDLDVDTFGIADMSRYGEEITGIGDLTAGELPFAVSFGIVLSVGVLGTLKDGPTQLYLHHYRQLNYRLDMIGYFLGRSMEREGFRAIPFAASQVVDWQRQRGHINHKKVGVMAGLGWIGRNNLLVHPLFGSQVRYNTVLTDMPLEVNRELGLDCGSCTACIAACPAGAIRMERSEFDHHGCYEMLSRFRKERNIGHHICGVCVKVCRGKR